MKYTSFRWLVRGGIVAVLVGGVIWLTSGRKSPPPAPEPRPVASAPPPTAPTPVAPAAAPRSVYTPGADADLRDMDRAILALVDATGEKKDALPSAPYKVNLYQDAGQPKINRLKIDLDRNGKWDEKWTREGDGWKRHVAPKDDEVYSVEVFLRGGRWDGDAASGPAAAPAPAPAPAPGGVTVLRGGDQRILERLKRPLGANGKNAVPDSGWKVNLYQDAGKTAVNRLKIDLDGDGKWDEKWTIDAGDIKREVAPADDEKYTEEWRLRGSSWMRK